MDCYEESYGWCIVECTLGAFSCIFLGPIVSITKGYLIYQHAKSRNSLKSPILYPLYTLFLYCLVMIFHYFTDNTNSNVSYYLMRFSAIISYTAILLYFTHEISLFSHQNHFTKKFGKILLLLNILYAIAVFVFSIYESIYEVNSTENCYFIGFVLLSGSKFVISLYLIYIGIVLSTLIYNLKGVKRRKIIELWYDLYRMLIAIIVLSSLEEFLGDMYVQVLRRKNCNRLYDVSGELNLVLFFFIRLFSQELFLFTALLVFRAKRRPVTITIEDDERALPSLIEDYNFSTLE